MKKFIIIIASLLFAVSAHAQFGVIAGITSSRSDIKSAIADVQGKNITQYHVGITYKFGGNVFAVQPALLYNVKGTALDVNDITSTKLDMKTGFIELPVQLQVGIGLGDIARIYGFAEPFIGYAISNSGTFNGTALKDLKWENIKNRLEYGVGVGLGVELIKHVQVSVKYFWNMGNLYNEDFSFAGVTKTITDSKANGIAASVALLF
jgi:hypothetical protein